MRIHGQRREPRLTRLLARPTYANVTATLALFLALTGTATAAITLGRDSVGAEHIQADAVRSSEIQAGAVRSSEILDESVALDDLTPGARSSLDAPRVRVDNGEGGYRDLETCTESFLDCPNLMAVHLPAGRWLVQAKLVVFGLFPTQGNPCGLVQSNTTVIDRSAYIGTGTDGQTSEHVSLTAVVTTAPDVDSTTVAVRCAEHHESEMVYWDNGKLTAIEVKEEAQTG